MPFWSVRRSLQSRCRSIIFVNYIFYFEVGSVVSYGRKEGGKEEWKEGRMEGRKNGKKEGRKEERKEVSKKKGGKKERRTTSVCYCVWVIVKQQGRIYGQSVVAAGGQGQ